MEIVTYLLIKVNTNHIYVLLTLWHPVIFLSSPALTPATHFRTLWIIYACKCSANDGAGGRSRRIQRGVESPGRESRPLSEGRGTSSWRNQWSFSGLPRWRFDKARPMSLRPSYGSKWRTRPTSTFPVIGRWLPGGRPSHHALIANWLNSNFRVLRDVPDSESEVVLRINK